MRDTSSVPRVPWYDFWRERERVYFSDIMTNNSLLTLNVDFYLIWLSCLCIDGIAEINNLFVLALVTSYFSECLVFTFLTAKGNISFVLSFLVHLTANLLLSIDLLAFKVLRFVR